MLYDNVHPSWDELFTDDFKKRLSEIEQKLDHLHINKYGYAYYPIKKNIMRFLQLDLTKIRCVILGMEPYPSCYDSNSIIMPVATGRSFEIANVYSWQQKFKQSSLRNILKTIYYNDTGKEASLDEIRMQILKKEFQIQQPDKWFDDLEKQGVLFLNATLTVEPNKPDSHVAIWYDVMTDVIRYIGKHNIKWLLFGKKAEKRVMETIGDEICTDNVYICCHPRLASFVKENIFANVSEIEWKGREANDH